MRHCFNFKLYLFIALFHQFASYATPVADTTFVLTDTTLIYRLDTYVDVLMDSSNTMSLEQVIDPVIQQRFHPAKDLAFGYTRSSVWLRLKMKSPIKLTQWYLEIPAPYLEYVDFYQRKGDGTWQHATAGYYRKQSEKIISHTGHVVPLLFDAKSENTIFIRIDGKSPKTFPLHVLGKERFHEKVRIEDIGYGVFYGILIVMMFYNLLLYLTLKEINYLLYIFTILCTIIIFLSATGYGGKFLWPENPSLNFYAGRMSMGVLTIVFTIFTIRFLEVKQHSKIMYYTLVPLIPLGIVANILVATDVVSSAGNNLITLGTILFMITGVVCRIKGNKTANFFIAAWTFYFVGGLLLTLRNSGVFEFNFWTTHFVEIGGALETIIIAFALGDQYRRFKKEKEDAQLMALKVQQEATEQLEIKVMVRTEQLSKAYEELHSTLEKNQQQTEIIENKNAELDTFFHRIAHDLRGPISSLLGLSFLAKIDIKDPIALDYINKQYQQVERLNQIISGLINLTKLSHDNLRKQKIDFHKMIDGCIASFESLPNYDKVSFNKHIQPDIDFHSEWTLLNAIMQNLIENAIKYSNENTPYVNIRVTDHQDHILLAVEDNGQGIPDHHQPKIFEMFFRATSNATGSGLGLYILKRSVDRLHGSVELKSKVGVGSVFTVKLPRLSGPE
ncbi:sensor histidine kinase [Chryseolinea sp. H1M3-3]|uniref:sensor histidine kinase n=1 Tax=Chryseolinea sp. H1M3-3 TaxID=3034144 RepID=UPI0023ED8239|nr:sensor histidine kinase [Chryseolinea sp. H1M3-3]